MSKHNPDAQRAEHKKHLAKQQLHTPHALKKLASSRLVPLKWADTLGIRRDDIDVFSAAAVGYEHLVIVRDTNRASLRYIGEPGYTPKPIDCKPKTAEQDAYVASIRRKVSCAGLVVDPTLVGFSAFTDKLGEALRTWHKFETGWTFAEQAAKIFPRRQSKGFYAIDTDPASERYGCMMLSQQDLPTADFSLDSRAGKEFKSRYLKYLHGDYDLYGLIDIAGTEKAIAARTLFSPALLETQLHGMRHTLTKDFENIKLFINTAIRCEMIQHAGQDNIGHKDDTLYVFYPDGSKYVASDCSADAIRDIYGYVFHQLVKT